MPLPNSLWMRSPTSRFEMKTTCHLLLVVCCMFSGLPLSMRMSAADDETDSNRLPPAVSRPVDFQREIEPLLAQSCVRCHNSERSEGGLRLDVARLALRGGDRGSAIVPGKSSESYLVQFASGIAEETRMPPEGEGKPLSPSQIGLIRGWIDQGANWPETAAPKERERQEVSHWSLRPLVRPVPPKVAKPQWVKNPIDQFVVARLDKEGISPSPPADRVTLIRRLSLDLTGLPPTSEAVSQFVNDVHEGAYERLVERLLASVHFGERWGRFWLDAARYADSDGYNGDGERPIWIYRDWVIRAFNADLPFDKFTIEQLAGDLLPHSTLDQKVATGFHRNTLLNLEGGNDAEEFRVERVVDRVNTTGTVFLGLSVGCAECHGHKYDPISQREYYQLFAFFNTSDEPTVDVPSLEQEARLASLKLLISKAETDLQEYDDAQTSRQAEWEARQHALRAWIPVTPQSVRVASEEKTKILEDGSVLLPNLASDTESIKLTLRIPPTGITGLRLDAMPDPSLPSLGPGRGSKGDFELSEIQIEAQANSSETRQAVLIEHAVTESSLPNRSIEKAIDGDPKTGWSPDPMTGGVRRYALFGFKQPVQFEDGGYLTVTLKHESVPGASLGRVLLSVTTTLSPAKLVSPNAVNVLVVAPDQRTKDQKKSLLGEFQSQDATRKPLLERLSSLRKQKSDIPQTLVIEESKTLRKTNIHIRGSFLRKGDTVTPDVPACLPGLTSASEVPNRLDLARWLVSEDQPLTARVIANRFWQILLGAGIVETENDFGTQGSPPSHPELLDWLASDFRSSQWSMKRLIYTIVTSATYRQSSTARPDLTHIDPANRLWARQSRTRLDAEFVRDAALSVAGLLATPVGGPSVFPYQPEGVMIGRRSSTAWVESNGADRFRRTMYTHFWRTSPHPYLMAFDAPKADATCTRRDRSNTPVQALTLLNDPPFVECARSLAGQVLGQRSHDPTSWSDTDDLSAAFIECVSRKPTAAELLILQNLLSAQRVEFHDQKESALLVAGNQNPSQVPVTEFAAWTAVCRALLNLDEFISRE